jgi:DivIVA domain-containing protein
VADDESSKASEREEPPLAATDAGQEPSFGGLRSDVPEEILEVSFPVTVRGYDRGAVDAYIERVSGEIAELKARASPPAAVGHALEGAEEKVQGLLHAAREAAGEITASAQGEAEESSARAKAEAAELIVHTSAEAERVRVEADELAAKARMEADAAVATAQAEAEEMLADASAEARNSLTRAQAEADERLQRLREELAALRREADARMREIQAESERDWKDRQELLGTIRRMAAGLVEVANAAAAPSSPPEAAEPDDEVQEPATGDETEPRALATEESARATPAVGSRKDGDDESPKQAAETTTPGPNT